MLNDISDIYNSNFWEHIFPSTLDALPDFVVV